MTDQPGSRFRRALTQDELDRIGDTAKKSGSKAGFDALWDIILLDAEGVTFTEAADEGRKFSVRDYAIPDHQDKQIQQMLSVPRSRSNRKRWSRRDTAMGFLFYGPAVYGTDD